MNVTILPQGPLATNCFVITNEDRAIVIDPNFELENITKHLKGKQLECILLTHGHIDHISALNEIKELYPQVPVFTHAEEKVYLTNPEYNLSIPFFQKSYIYSGEVQLLEDGQNFSCLGTSIRILHTPGHSFGSLSYYFPEDRFLVSGDVIFKNGIGRTDLFGSDHDLLIQTIKAKLLILPNETVIYPGHGETTTVGSEKANNLFLR